MKMKIIILITIFFCDKTFMTDINHMLRNSKIFGQNHTFAINYFFCAKLSINDIHFSPSDPLRSLYIVIMLKPTIQ